MDIVLSGIINMPSHLCSFFTDGYGWSRRMEKNQQTAYSTKLQPATFVNRVADESEESIRVKKPVYDVWRETASSDGDFGTYTNVKFGPLKGESGLYTQVPAQTGFDARRRDDLQRLKLAMSGKTGEAKSFAGRICQRKPND